MRVGDWRNECAPDGKGAAQTVKDWSPHIPTFAMLTALLLILATLVTLSLSGQKPESPILLGLVSAASGMAGAIGGFSMNSSGRAPTITNSPGANFNSDTTQKEDK